MNNNNSIGATCTKTRIQGPLASKQALLLQKDEAYYNYAILVIL